ncbi:MAG: DNA repair protein RecO [Saprospiraceae bacterium]|jgi:DNA repair protein RecO (recombination protein O)|nr:DNA repair protein RecO [Saprospiraceae bacterium]MBK6479888.1 DNA repair protein RecO [Saprospiraceae bacterium]MBK6815255.1 DNA repair protein RecO [Saprospiraceae bacterium]MBK7372292.1 DNA repair protein RecO [Saprospiraceae bacterium]MBK7435242.1 DNA repair protein RecO [Saprospiraceae bacterium]
MSSLIQIEGIVLKTNKYGETSIISQILTRDHGLQSFIMGGVNGNHGKAGMFQIMNQLDIVTYFNEHKSIHRIKEARYAKIYQTLPFEMQRTAVGVFMLELLRKCIQDNDFDQEMYDWVVTCLDHTDDPPMKVTWIPLYFLLGLTRYLGIYPLKPHVLVGQYFDLREGRFIDHEPYHRDALNAACTRLLSILMEHHDAGVWTAPLESSKQDRKDLLYGLLDYYKFHLGHFNGLESPHILEEILTA